MHSPSRLFRNARREALVVLALWAVSLIWTVGYCVTRGYLYPPEAPLVQNGVAVPRSGDDLGTVLGVPDWVFWGIVLPWVLLTVVTVVFALFVMTDDDLGRETGDETHGP